MQIDKNCDRKLSEFINGDDLDFYEEYTINLSDKEQQEFFTDIRLISFLYNTHAIVIECFFLCLN